jgi:hypothetical protein
MPSKIWDEMHWGDRMHCREIAVITVLKPEEMTPEIEAQDMMVEQDYRSLLIKIAHHKLMQETNDYMLEWLAKVIKKAWLDQTSFVLAKYGQALKRMLHYLWQQLP